MTEDAVLARVIVRCEAWAEWTSREQGGGLGYPSTSLEYRVLRGVWVRQRAPVQRAYPDSAEETERWIREMARHYPRLAQVLCCYYLEASSLREGARRLGISHTYFKSQLTLAHHWLAGKLQGERG